MAEPLCKTHGGYQMGTKFISGKILQAHAKRNNGCQLPGICAGLLGSHCTGCGNRV